MRQALVILALLGGIHAQTVVVGRTDTTGRLVISPRGTVTPPPPAGINISFFASSWNSGTPATWPPKDSQGHNAVITAARIHDDGMKLQNMFSCSGGTCTAINPGPFTGILKTFMTSNVPSYPMDTLYVFSAVPTGAAQGTDPICTVTTSACTPFTDLDSNQGGCNAVGVLQNNNGNTNGSANATVLANCGNGSDSMFQFMIWKILSTYSFQAVECWNEPDGAGNFWSNSTTFGGSGHAPTCSQSGGIGCEEPQMVRMVRMCSDVQHIANAIDPNIKIYSPSFHGPTAQTWMHLYANTTVNDPGCNSACGAKIGGITWPAKNGVTGKSTFNVTNAHIRGSGTTTGEGAQNASPEAFLTQYANVLAEVQNDNLPTLITDDEWGPVNQSSCQSSTFDYLAYYVGAGLLTRASVNLYREYYYQWDSHAAAGQCPNDTGASGPGNPAAGSIAGTAWDTVAGWVIGASVGATVNTGSNYSIVISNVSGTAGLTGKAVWNAGTVSVSTITAAAASSGGNQTLTCSGGCAGLAGEYITVAGFSTTCVVGGQTIVCNNGPAVVQSSTATSIVVNNPNGVAETKAATATYLPLTCGTSCQTQTISGFTHWTDLTGTIHNAPTSVFPVGAKPILLTP